MKRLGSQARVISAENFELVKTYISYRNIISHINPAVVNDEVKEKSASADHSNIEDACFEEVTHEELAREKARKAIEDYGYFGRPASEELNNVRYRILKTREYSEVVKDDYTPLERKRERYYQQHVSSAYTPKGGWYDSSVR